MEGKWVRNSTIGKSWSDFVVDGESVGYVYRTYGERYIAYHKFASTQRKFGTRHEARAYVMDAIRDALENQT